MDLPVLTGLISCLKLIDLDIFSGLAGAKVTAAEGPGGWAKDTSRRTRACHCKGNEGCQVEPGTERYEDSVEEAGGEDVAVEVGERAL